MMHCKDCPRKKGDACSIMDWRGVHSHLRCCSNAFILDAGKRINPGDIVLEVGYGPIRVIRRVVKKQEAIWFGIDKRRGDADAVHRKCGRVSKMPYPDDMFDCCMCTQSIEHWEEGRRSQRDKPTDGLREIHRVLKPNGWLALDAPMGFHGCEPFVREDVCTVLGYFDPDLWHITSDQWLQTCYPARSWNLSVLATART